MTGTPRSVGILEDDPYFRAHLEDIIGATDDLYCAFSEGTLSEALVAFEQAPPALCLVDLALPDGRGIDLILEANRTNLCRVLVLSVLGDRKSVIESLRAGAHGYVLKDAPAGVVIDSIRQTLSGYAPISPQIATYLTGLLTAAAASDGADPVELTTREEQILSIFARGLTYSEAAEVLGVSTHTVSDFVKKIYRKLNVHSRSEAVFEARNMGLIHRD